MTRTPFFHARRSNPRRPRSGGKSFLIGALVLLAACSSLTSDEPPAADSTVVEVLIEFHLAGARNVLYHDLSPSLRDSVLTRYGLDTTRFDGIMRYYADHPEAYADLYATVLDRISAERAAHLNLSPGNTAPRPPGRPGE